MDVESSDDLSGNNILRGCLTNKPVVDSFKNARKCNIRTYGNTLLVIPGTSLFNLILIHFFLQKS